MKFISLLTLILFLSSCGTSDKIVKDNTNAVANSKQTDENIRQFKNAIALVKNNQFDEAKNTLVEISKEKPGLAGPNANLAILYIRGKDYDSAFKHASMAMKAKPGSHKIQNLMGFIHQEKGNILDAEKHYKRAIELNPGYAKAHYNLALIYDIYLSNIGSAIKHYEKYLELINNSDQKTHDWLQQLKSQYKS